MRTSDGQTNRNRGAEVALGVSLLARAGAAFGLSIWLHVDEPGWQDLFHDVGIYALLDGGLGMLSAALFAAAHFRGGPAALVSLTFADALVRLGLGATLLTVPAVSEVPTTVVPLLGAMGATAALLGVLGIVSWRIAHHRRRREHSLAYEVFFDPIPVIALVSIALGTRLFIDPPSTAAQLRSLITIGGLAVSIGFVLAAIGGVAEGLRVRQ